MMQLLAGAGPGQGQRVPGKSWSRPRLWPSSCAMEEATPRMLVEWSCGGGELRSTLVLSPGTSQQAPPPSSIASGGEPRPGSGETWVPSCLRPPASLCGPGRGPLFLEPQGEDLPGEGGTLTSWPFSEVPGQQRPQCAAALSAHFVGVQRPNGTPAGRSSTGTEGETWR